MALVGTLPLILGGNKMPLTIKDFEKKKVEYEYKNYRIKLIKKDRPNAWDFFIKRQLKNHEYIAIEHEGRGYFFFEDARADAMEYINEKEYKPKFKRGDIISIIQSCDNHLLPNVIRAIRYIDDGKYFFSEVINPMSIWEKGNIIMTDRCSKKIGEITDMSILEGE